ncbi:hypothetical protein NCS56_01347600 [Fusarium sp. Ph1]|nr:hypothetical protein NCS56_01347600 [Fusarium sp. Ph1]
MYFRRLSEGTFTSSFEFTLNDENEETVWLRSGSIRWELQVVFQRPRPFATPLLQLTHQIMVIRDAASPTPIRKALTDVKRWNSQDFEVVVPSDAVPIGSSIQVKANLLGLAGRLERYSIECVLVEMAMHLQRVGTAWYESLKAEISLSTDHQWKNAEYREHVWIPITFKTQSTPVVVDFQLPTCPQIRQARMLPLNPSCTALHVAVKHHLEIRLRTDLPVNNGSKISDPFIIPLTLISCRTNRWKKPPVNLSSQDKSHEKTVFLSRCGCYDSEVSPLRCYRVPRDDGSHETILVPSKTDTSHESTEFLRVGGEGGTDSQALHPRRSITTYAGCVDEDETSSMASLPPDYVYAVGEEDKDERNDDSSDSRHNYPEPNTERVLETM